MDNTTTIWVLFLVLLAAVIGRLMTRRRGGTKVRATEQIQRVEGQEEGGQPYKVFYEYGIAYRVPVYSSDESRRDEAAGSHETVSNPGS